MGGTKALFSLVVGMGVLILAGLAVVVATLTHRMLVPVRPAAPMEATTLGEPPGTRVGGFAAAGDRLALLLQGGGAADRVVLLDARDGSRVGTITISGGAIGGRTVHSPLPLQ